MTEIKELHLMYLTPQSLLTDGRGRYALDSKALSAVRTYSTLWSGAVTIATKGVATGAATPNDGLVWFYPDEEAFDVFVDENYPLGLRARRPDVLMALHTFAHQELVDLELPVVLICENDLMNRQSLMAAINGGLLSRIRSSIGLARRELTMKRMVKKAAGIQCNGFAAWNSYSQLNHEPMTFHDHRIYSKDIDMAIHAKAWDGSVPLRLGFSGRLHPIKGPEYVIQLATKLALTHPEISLHIMGSGGVEAELRRVAPPNVVFEGYLDFETQWKDIVRERIDLMVLPHVQGDPSCTYFESLGCGAPILGFRNSTLTPLVEQTGAGWAVKRRDVGAMVKVVDGLVANPVLLHEARRKGLAFMQANSYESVSCERIRHLDAVARSSGMARKK